MENEKIYTVAEIAEITGLHISTINKWAKKLSLPKFGNGVTCAFECNQNFYNFINNNIKPRKKRK